MNLLNLPDWNVERVEDSARDYRVHATYIPEPGHCPTCGLFARLYHHGTERQRPPRRGQRVDLRVLPEPLAAVEDGNLGQGWQ